MNHNRINEKWKFALNLPEGPFKLFNVLTAEQMVSSRHLSVPAKQTQSALKSGHGENLSAELFVRAV